MHELCVEANGCGIDEQQDYRENLEDPALLSALDELGLKYLFPYQRLAIANILDTLAECSHDEDLSVPRQLVILPTGFGKSACFQIPALMCSGLTVVVYPLLGLMSDQARRLEGISKPVFCLSGNTRDDEVRKIRACLSSSGNAVILTNPETLGGRRFADCISGTRIQHLVIDEAHCLAEWGDTFRPSYSALSEFIADHTPDMLSAFTASASSPVLARITHLLFGSNTYRLIVSGTDRPNIFYRKVWTVNRLKTLRDIALTAEKPMLIFTRSRTGAELLASELSLELPETAVFFYHAGLEPQEKKRIEELFLDSSDGILTATCAYGMGMDKKNVRTVIHYDIPESAEAYIQEAGRAGRDGKPAEACLLVPWPPEPLPKNDLNEDIQSYSGKAAITFAGEFRKGQMLSYAYQDVSCRRSLLLGFMGSEDCVCTGCDVCEGTATTLPGEIVGMLATVRRHRFRFTNTELSDFLKGKSGQELASGYASYASWSHDDIAGAVSELCRSGYLQKRRGIFKGLSLSPRALLLLARVLP